MAEAGWELYEKRMLTIFPECQTFCRNAVGIQVDML